MAEKIMDIFNKIINIDSSEERNIIFDNKTTQPYFNAKNMCKLLGYKDFKRTMKSIIKKDDIFHLKDIDKNYKKIYNNTHGHTNFINEAGLMTLIIKGKNEISKKIFEWLTRDVLQSIRKNGEYKMNDDLKIQMDEINEIIKEKMI